jgi:hypothetical protein
MKGTTVLIVLLVSGLVLAFGRAGHAFNPDAAGSLSKTQTLESRASQHPQLMADRTETKDRIIYGTDPEMERAMEEQQREEKEKEEKAWNMLQHMNIYKDNEKKPRPAQPGNTPPQ